MINLLILAENECPKQVHRKTAARHDLVLQQTKDGTYTVLESPVIPDTPTLSSISDIQKLIEKTAEKVEE
jgi:hypothetical protein